MPDEIIALLTGSIPRSKCEDMMFKFSRAYVPPSEYRAIICRRCHLPYGRHYTFPNIILCPDEMEQLQLSELYLEDVRRAATSIFGQK